MGRSSSTWRCLSLWLWMVYSVFLLESTPANAVLLAAQERKKCPSGVGSAIDSRDISRLKELLGLAGEWRDCELSFDMHFPMASDIEDTKVVGTALHQAVSRHFVAGVQFLLYTQGFDINLRLTDPGALGVGGFTAIMLSAWVANDFDASREVMKALFWGEQAKMNTVNEAGDTALMVGMKSPGFSASHLNMFLEQGCDVNVQNAEGNNALMLAIINNKRGTVIWSLLKVHNIDVAAKNKDGRTALQICLEHNSATSDTLQLMLDSGVPVRSRDEEAPSCLKLSIKNQNSDQMRLLLKVGARLDQDLGYEDLETLRSGLWLASVGSDKEWWDRGGDSKPLLRFVTDVFHSSSLHWDSLWATPEHCRGDLEDKCSVNLLAHVRSQELARLLVELQTTGSENEKLQARREALRAMMLMDNIPYDVFSLLCAYGSCDDLRVSGPHMHWSRSLQTQNRLHWIAKACDARALDIAMTHLSTFDLERMVAKTDSLGATPVGYARSRGCRAAVYCPLKVMEGVRPIDAVAAFLAFALCLGILVLSFLGAQKRTRNRCLLSGVPMPLFLVGTVNVILVPAMREDCNSSFDVWCAALAILSSIGLELFIQCFLVGAFKLESGILEAESKKIICAMSWFLAIFLTTREIAVLADQVGYVFGIALAVFSTLQCVSCMWIVTIIVNVLTMLAGLPLLYWFGAASTQVYWRPAQAARPESALIIATLYGVALADLAGGLRATLPASSEIKETELTLMHQAPHPESAGDYSNATPAWEAPFPQGAGYPSATPAWEAPHPESASDTNAIPAWQAPHPESAGNASATSWQAPHPESAGNASATSAPEAPHPESAGNASATPASEAPHQESAGNPGATSAGQAPETP